MNELELRQMFKNLSDCYADTWIECPKTGKFIEGEVIQAMTEDRFIEALREAKLLPMPGVVGRSEQLKAFADYAQKRMWEDGDKDLSEFVEEFESL